MMKNNSLVYFFIHLLILSITLCNVAEARLIYIGTQSNSLYLCEFDDISGNITLKYTYEVASPSFVALHPSREYIYLVNENGDFDNQNNTGGISAYSVDVRSGALKLINSVLSHGANPAHIGIDETGRWLGVANYFSGNYGVWKINGDFSIATEPTSFKQDIGHGPAPQQIDGPHAHEFVFGRNNSFVVVPDLGNDQWNQYLFDHKTGALTNISAVIAPVASGPRHFAFHPYLPYAYGISELASTITTFSVPHSLQSLSVLQRISTLPQPQASAAAAEIQFSPDGRFLYASTRFLTNINGTITVYAIDESTGLLSSPRYYSTQGLMPRFFTLSLDGRFVLVANQNSNNTKVFERYENGEVGRLVSTLDGISFPTHILFL